MKKDNNDTEVKTKTKKTAEKGNGKDMVFLIEKLISERSDLNWASEMKAARALLKKYSSIDFWKTFMLPFEINSLYFLLSNPGKKLLESHKEKFIAAELEKRKKSNMEDVLNLDANADTYVEPGSQDKNESQDEADAEINTDKVTISVKPKSFKSFIKERRLQNGQKTN